MSIFAAAESRAQTRAERRSVFPNNPLTWAMGMLPSGKTKSGVDVTVDNALSLSTVFMAKTLISEAIAQLPFAPYIEEQVEGRTNSNKHKGHFTYPLVAKRPHPYISAFNFRNVMQSWACLYDDAYAIITRNGNAQATGLLPWHPDMIEPEIQNGRLVYQITNWDGTQETVGFMNVFHLVGNTDNGISGKSRIRIGKEGIGKAIAAQEFGAQYFGKGINISGFIKTPKLLKDQDAVERLKKGFVKKYAGRNNAFGVGLLEDGAEFEQMETDPEKAQLTETEKVDAREIANRFVMPVTMLNQLERGTYNNVEQLFIQFVNHTLIPWGRRWEQESWFKLLTEREKRADKISFKFNFKGLMQGDSAARAQFYESLAKVGAYSPNKILEKEDENGYDGGDVHIVSPGATSVEEINNPSNGSENGDNI